MQTRSEGGYAERTNLSPFDAARLFYHAHSPKSRVFCAKSSPFLQFLPHLPQFAPLHIFLLSAKAICSRRDANEKRKRKGACRLGGHRPQASGGSLRPHGKPHKMSPKTALCSPLWSKELFYGMVFAPFALLFRNIGVE